MKWGDLTSKKKRWWNNFAKRNQTLLKLFVYFVSFDKRKRCSLCKYRFERGILDKYPHKFVPLIYMFRGEFLAHLHQTHGIPPDMFLLQLKEFIKK